MDDKSSSKDITLRMLATLLVMVGCAVALSTHFRAVIGSSLDPVSSPIGALIQTENAAWFRWGLWLFAISHIGLVVF